MADKIEKPPLIDAVVGEIYDVRDDADLPEEFKGAMHEVQVWDIRSNGDIHIKGARGAFDEDVTPEEFSRMCENNISTGIILHRIGKFFEAGVQKISSFFRAPSKK